MTSKSLSVPENINAQEAIALTKEIISEIEQGQLSSARVESLIKDVVNRKNSARGF